MKPVHEKIHVYARSKKGSVEPIQFIWKHRTFQILRIHSTRKQVLKQRTIFNFVVSTLPTGKYELEFDLKSGQWYLVKIYSDDDP